MKPTSTTFLRAVVILIGMAVLALCLIAVPAGIRHDEAGAYQPILWGLYAPAVPFFIAAWSTLKLLSYIDHNQAFSLASVDALKHIKYCAATIGAIFAAAMPYIVLVAERDDAPGVAAIGLVITFASLAIAVFAAILQALFADAIRIKSENDLTV